MSSSTSSTTTTVTLPADPGRTPDEEAQLVARVAAAVAEQTGNDVNVELVASEQVDVRGSVADRMQGSDRWTR